MKKLEWNVYRYNINGRSIERYNIFDHYRFAEDVKKDLKRCKTKEEFEKYLKSNLMYYFGFKCEWEVVITSFPPHVNKEELDRLNNEYEDYIDRYGHEPYSIDTNPTVGEKIDVYQQCMLNFSVLCDCVWESKG